jgi:phosphoribosylglycinamide formyltransferase-1
MKNIILLTGSELRHEFFRKYLASFDSVNVLQTFCESQESNLANTVSVQDNNDLRSKHLSLRTQTEKDFFEIFCDRIEDKSNPIAIKKGEINAFENVELITSLNPDIIISYGCSIIKSSLIEQFNRRFINIHLGLSPYYRGSGTNFWPFVNNELQYVGVTYMYIDKGIDTGEIIHQIRPRIYMNDDIHKIGNRLIYDMSKVMVKIINHHSNLDKLKPIPFEKVDAKLYKNKDFTEESTEKMYLNFENNLITNYLNNKTAFDLKAPILTNSIIENN